VFQYPKSNAQAEISLGVAFWVLRRVQISQIVMLNLVG
jgi:hypothetical protein